MILDRYLTKEMIPNFLIGLMVFTFVMLMNQILVLAEVLVTKGVEFVRIFLIIFYLLPALTVLTIPMALLLGTLLGLGRLNSDSELTVMRASGISLYRLMVPIFGIGVFCWIVCTYLIQVWVPWGNSSFGKLMYQIVTTNVASELKPRIFYRQFPRMMLYVQDIPSKGGEWNGVLIFDESQEKGRLVLAKNGFLERKQGQTKELELQLLDGSWHEVDPSIPQDYTFVDFSENTFPLPTPPELQGEIPKGDRDMTIPELKAKIAEYRGKKIPTRFLEVELHKKYSIPFACMVFAFLAVNLGFTSKKGSRSSAYAVSIGIIMLYYVFLIGGERLGDAGKVSPWFGAWSPNILLGGLGMILFLWSNSNLVRRMIGAIVGGGFFSVTRVTGQPAIARNRVRIVIRIKRWPWRLFTVIDKYIVREFVKNFVLILIALVVIAELIEATQLVDDLFRNNVPVSVLLQYLKFNLPQWFFYVAPVTALTTTLVTFGLFSKNSEIIAMRASGISLYRIALPVILLAMLLSIMTFWLQDYILPATNEIAHQYKDTVKGRLTDTQTIYERHWIAASDGFYNYDLFDSSKNKMYGFSIYQLNMEDFSLRRRIYAREAVFDENRWHLKNGWERSFTSKRVRYETFTRKELKLPVNREYFTSEQELPSEMDFRELQDYIAKMKHRGFDVVRFTVDLQAKISFPTVSLILTLIAIPFSFTMGKRGALYGIGLSIVMGIVFWFFLALTKSLGYLEVLNPFLAAWTPNILATLVALYLLFKLRT